MKPTGAKKVYSGSVRESFLKCLIKAAEGKHLAEKTVEAVD